MEKNNQKIKRILTLKKETIKRYSKEIQKYKKEFEKEGFDLENDIYIYDIMMKHIFNGDLFEVFTSPSLEELSKKERIKILKNVQPHLSLCLEIPGYFDGWSDTLLIRDYKATAYSVLNDIDLIIEIFLENGEKSLNFLQRFHDWKNCYKPDYRKSYMGSPIQYFKNNFPNEEVLKIIIKKMAKKNSPYNIFSEEEKNLLLAYPSGNLFFYDINTTIITNPNVLKNILQEQDPKELQKIISNTERKFIRNIEYIIPEINAKQIIIDNNEELSKNYFKINDQEMSNTVSLKRAKKNKIITYY